MLTDILSDTFWNATPFSPALDGYYDIIITTRTTKYYMDIAPNGYYDIIITTRSTKYYKDIIWILHQVDFMTFNSTTCSGMGSTPHSWYSGGRGFDLDVGMYKKSALNLLKICILCKSGLALFSLPIFQVPICGIMFDSVCIYICNCVQYCIWTSAGKDFAHLPQLAVMVFTFLGARTHNGRSQQDHLSPHQSHKCPQIKTNPPGICQNHPPSPEMIKILQTHKRVTYGVMPLLSSV